MDLETTKASPREGLTISERRDLNPRPPLPQSGTLPSCATPRFYPISIIALFCLDSAKDSIAL